MSSKAARRCSDYRRKKRRFCGNQHSPSVTQNNTSSALPCLSASAKKLRLDTHLDERPNTSKHSNGYRLVNIDILLSELSQFLICNNCSSRAALKERVVYGLVSEFYVECKSCSKIFPFKSSPLIEQSNHAYEVNSRIIYAMRTVGLGLRGIKNFCTAMDLPPPVSQKSYDSILKNIKVASCEVAEKSMKNGAKEEISSTESNEICISGDGTWKTRGHTSRLGVCSVIGDITGKVLDVEVMSSYCKGCEQWKKPKSGAAYEVWKKKHQPQCVKNHFGSSNKMEVDGMKRIFQRSLLERNAKYVKYIGDGDTKTFPELQVSVPYTVEKVECVGHVQKRMGTRLRKLKLMNRGKKLSDGKSIGGKNRLTDKIIDKLTTYYGNAIRENSSSVENMRKAIWAIYCHYSSTDAKPMHYFCPEGKKSWCEYQKSKATMMSYKHKNIVPTAVMEEIKPIFAELSAPKLLERCLGGKTQNANESFNSTIWKYCPKISGASKTVVDIAVNEATVMFNEGMTGRIKIMKCLGFKIGHYCQTSALQADYMRVKQAEKKCMASTLVARRANRMRNKAKHEHFLELEGPTYEAGAF